MKSFTFFTYLVDMTSQDSNTCGRETPYSIKDVATYNTLELITMEPNGSSILACVYLPTFPDITVCRSKHLTRSNNVC